MAKEENPFNHQQSLYQEMSTQTRTIICRTLTKLLCQVHKMRTFRKKKTKDIDVLHMKNLLVCRMPQNLGTISHISALGQLFTVKNENLIFTVNHGLLNNNKIRHYLEHLIK